MKKFFVVLFFLFSTSLIFISCSDNSTNPTGGTGPTTGSVYITSNPSGAQIFQGTTNTNKVTPDSVTNLSPGVVNFTLKLTNYRDTTIAATVTAGQRSNISVALTSSADLKSFGPVIIYETVGTTAQQPSGLNLASGTAVSISSASEKSKADLYYSSDGFVIASTYNVNGISRNTYFLVGNSSSLNDHVPSPQFSSSDARWVRSVSDREPNYVFVYDGDGHYSKMKLQQSGGTPGVPSQDAVTWIYNNTAGSTIF